MIIPSPPLAPGGNPVIASQTHKFNGIRNGIDPELWDPENNQWLPMPFSSKNVVEGKAAARRVRWLPTGSVLAIQSLWCHLDPPRPSTGLERTCWSGGMGRQVHRGRREQADGPEGRPAHQACGVQDGRERRAVCSSGICPGPQSPGEQCPHHADWGHDTDRHTRSLAGVLPKPSPIKA